MGLPAISCVISALIMPNSTHWNSCVVIPTSSDGCLAFARKRGASELGVPSMVMVVEALPVLGSGKIDHPAVARKVAALIAEGADATAD